MSYWLKSFRTFICIEIKDAYPTVWAFWGSFVGILLSLTVYWFTSKAFTPVVGEVFGNLQTNYFTFVLVGELILMLPLVLLEGTIRTVRQAVAQGTMESLLMLPMGHQLPIILWGLAKFPIELVRVFLTLIFALVFFDFQINLLGCLGAIGLILICIPMFMGFGLIASAILISFGRGDKAITILINVATIFSGIYFPIKVLPANLQFLVQVFSPFYFLLHHGRNVMIQGADSTILTQIAPALIGGIAIFLSGYYLVGLSFYLAKKRGSNFLFRY